MSDDNNNSGGRSLGGGPSEPLPENWGGSQSNSRRVGRVGEWNSSSSSGNNSRGIRTLGDSGSAGGGGFSLPLRGAEHPDDDDSEDEEGGDQGESWFAGGERSGLSIQNPDRRGAIPGGRMVRDLLRRAAEEGASGPITQGGAFSGAGNRLGSDELPSQYIPDPAANQVQPTIRHLTFWKDGFSVEDGDLLRYDDPENSELLAQIQAGRAPPSILNVQEGEPVELNVTKRLEEEFPTTRRAFTGTGHRLGAPVPEVASSSSSMPGAFPAPAAAPSSSASGDSSNIVPKFEVDQSQPTTSVQIRLADGTRMVCRMNLTHTVLDLRNFINASRPENLTRPYTIGTTFPNRTLDDNTATVEAAGLKNSVVVQRWV